MQEAPPPVANSPPSEDTRRRYGNVVADGLHKYQLTVSSLDCQKYAHIKKQSILFDVYQYYGHYRVYCYTDSDGLLKNILDVTQLPVHSQSLLAVHLTDRYTDIHGEFTELVYE